MNYTEAFDLYSNEGEATRIEWLDATPKIDEEYLLKREYYFDIPPTMKKLLSKKLPLNMRLDFAERHLSKLEANDKLMQAIVDGSKEKASLPDKEEKS